MAEYQNLISAANPQTRGLDSQNNKMGLFKPGRSNSETVLQLKTKVLEQIIMSYFREEI